MTTPAIRAIRHGYPSTHITLLAKPWVVPVFENSPDIDEIMIYDANGRHRRWTGLGRLATDVRRGNFDAAILFQNAFEAALISFLAGIPKRVGFTTDGRTALLTDRIRSWRPLKRGHLIDYYLGIVSGAGLPLRGRRLSLFLTGEEKAEARRFLDERGGPLTSPLIGFSPGATFGTAKRWPPERFAALGKRMVSELDARILIFGAPAEAELGNRLAAEIGSRCLNLSGQTSLRRTMALINLCNLFVTNDSGLMHVAAALNIPQVAIIGPTDPIATGPSNETARIVQAQDACEMSPCLSPHCPIGDHRCMMAIEVDSIFDAALDRLAFPKTGGP